MNIGLDLSIDDAYTRGIARGIIHYAKTVNNWNILGSDWMFLSHSLDNLDGIIARIENQEQADKLLKYKVPIVDVAGAGLRRGFFEVHNDDYTTGKLAGRYLMSLGHDHFAWAGMAKVRWSKYRFEGFINQIAHKAKEVQETVFEKELIWWEKLDFEIEDLCTWLQKLSKPTAIFAANDTVGLKITRACVTSNIEIPTKLAILGVDNEDILCELANPSLSSIQIDCEKMGFKASELLDKLIHPTSKNFQKFGHQVVAPLEIIERESTKISIAKNPLVEKALNFIQNKAHTGITVDDVLKEVPTSRRNLEQKFLSEMGRTLHDEIILSKIATSKALLKDTNYTLEVIAQKSGFGSLQRFHSHFKTHEELTPGEWRKKQTLQ